jgi:aspartate/tyrosine/aromatic aminotransferase
MSTKTTSSFFESVELLPEDSILSIPIAFKADNRPQKVNLGVGAYRDALGNPYTLISVRDAEQILHDLHLDKEYLPIIGEKRFLEEITKLIFGNTPKASNGEITVMQTPGSTGAIFIGLEFLHHQLHSTVYIPNFTWPNHPSIPKIIGMPCETYPYYDPNSHSLNFERMCQSIEKMEPDSVIILQVCCHNPTGQDPTIDQWKQLSTLIKERRIIPFFDFAYQGFGEDVEKDAEPVRLFLREGHEMFVAHSCAKNFGLYGERVGCLAIVAQQPALSRKVESQIKFLARSSYSNAPLHGGRIVGLILSDEKLKTEWQHELKNMRDRLMEMREALSFGLQTKFDHMDFQFIRKQKGFFSLLGISPDKIKRLKDEFAIYMPPNGRITFSGVNMSNLDYLVDSIGKVMNS